jgi:hypothetical protein
MRQYDYLNLWKLAFEKAGGQITDMNAEISESQIADKGGKWIVYDEK